MAVRESAPGILHIWRTGTGGVEMMLCQLVEKLDDVERHYIVALMAGGGLRDRALGAGARLEELDLRRGQVSLRAAARLAGIARRVAPRLMQGWTYHSNIAATLAFCTSGRPPWSGASTVRRNLAADKPMTRRVIRIGAWLSRLPAAIVYPSRSTALSMNSWVMMLARRS